VVIKLTTFLFHFTLRTLSPKYLLSSPLFCLSVINKAISFFLNRTSLLAKSSSKHARFQSVQAFNPQEPASRAPEGRCCIEGHESPPEEERRSARRRRRPRHRQGHRAVLEQVPGGEALTWRGRGPSSSGGQKHTFGTQAGVQMELEEARKPPGAPEEQGHDEDGRHSCKGHGEEEDQGAEGGGAGREGDDGRRVHVAG
jgi:hypothetical protein